MPKHCGMFIKCNNAEGCFGCEYEGEDTLKAYDPDEPGHERDIVET